MKIRIKRKEKPLQTQIAVECRHHWSIDIADGPISRGICKICGETKDFFNYFPEFSVIKKNPVGMHDEANEYEPDDDLEFSRQEQPERFKNVN